MQRKSPAPIDHSPELESKEIPDKFSDSDSENDDPREEIQHIAFHLGVEKVKLNRPQQNGSFSTMNAQLQKLGETPKDAFQTSAGVVAVAASKGKGLTFTPEDLLALNHGPMHTGGYDNKGYAVKPVIKQIDEYAIEDHDKTLIVTFDALEQFRQERFKTNREIEPGAGCCPRMFGKKASDGEFNALNRLYPARKTTIRGQEELCHTLADLKEFYFKPFKAGQKVIDRVAKNKLEELASDSNKKCRR